MTIHNYEKLSKKCLYNPALNASIERDSQIKVPELKTGILNQTMSHTSVQ
jgi:hypothetical protein